MQPMSPYRDVALVGRGTLRTVVIPLDIDIVRGFLPYGVELGECPASLNIAPGKHPILLFFYDMYSAHMNVPAMLPNMTYHEHVFGIPYTYTTVTPLNPVRSGPFFWMPILLLNNIWATSGGVLFWGFPKKMAHIQVTAVSGQKDTFDYAVSEKDTNYDTGQHARIVSCRFKPDDGDRLAVSDAPWFTPVREILDQPMLTSLPAALGPFFVCSNFQKVWGTAEIEPLKTRVTVSQEYVQGVPTRSWPKPGEYAGGMSADNPIGSFVLHAQWKMGLIYPTWFHSEPMNRLAQGRAV